MYRDKDLSLVKKVFQLSDSALIRMINHLFGTEYPDEEQIWRDWQGRDEEQIWLTIAGMNRYVFSIRRFQGCLQIQAEDKGCLFYEMQESRLPVVQIKEPRVVCFGQGEGKEYSKILEFPGHERVILPIHTMTLSGCSACQMAENGFVLFLPFLFYYLAEAQEEEEKKQERIKGFVLSDMPNALRIGLLKGDVNVYDAQRLKRICRQMAWRLLSRKSWMQNLEFQELLLDALDADLDMLQKVQDLKR